MDFGPKRPIADFDYLGSPYLVTINPPQLFASQSRSETGILLESSSPSSASSTVPEPHQD
ncbi:hypothetical protein Ocin01_19066 [Orchesella cincta]|uniref:Uncharacterized protein n=1 Tax=Orchesella cincta TaxID=48709 RepID=A0A1D2M3T9_ORCCI|nr:hypothetical protein Ocin01_19066 [Orchesella cincta]